MNTKQFRDSNAAVIAAMLLVGAVAILPIALDVARASVSPSKPEPAAKAEHTCFDRHMRAHRCDALSTAVAADVSRGK